MAETKYGLKGRDYEVKNRAGRDLAEQVAGELGKREIPFFWVHRGPSKSPNSDSSLYAEGVVITAYHVRRTISVHGMRDEDFKNIEELLRELNLERIYAELLNDDDGNKTRT